MRRPKTRSSTARRVQTPSRAEDKAKESGNGRPFGSSTSLARSSYTRSRSRARSSGRNNEEGGTLPTHHKSSSRYRDRKRSRSRSRRPSSITKRLILTPSRIWRSMPIKYRIITLFSGFIFVYYGVFGKHHYFDREMSSIQSDVEKLLQHANRSGFLQRNFVEAELPEIFRNGDEPTPTKSPIPSPKKEGDTAKIASPGEVNGKDSTSKTGKGAEKGTEEGKKKKKSKDKGKKEKKDSKKKSKAKAKKGKGKKNRGKGKKGKGGEEEDSANDEVATDTETLKEAAASKSSPSSLGEMVVEARNSTSTNDTTSNIPTESEHATNNTTLSTGAVTDRSNLTGDANATSDLAVTAASEGSPDGSMGATLGATPDSNTNSSSASTVAAQPVVSPSGALEQASNTSDASGAGAGAGVLGGSSEEDSANLSKEFHDLTPDEVPKEHLPVLTWNYEAVLDPNTPEQIFGLGDKLDHVAVYKPLCISPNDGVAYIFEGKTVCSGFNRTAGWLIQYCSVMRESLQKEYLLSVSRERKPRTWLKENEASIRWVEGLTVLQILEKNCGNIAHYSGRILLLQHIMENIMAYVAPPSQIMNVLIVPTFHIMKRFLYPHNYEFWHKTLLTALLAPSKYTIGTLGNFLYRDSKPRTDKTPMVQLLHNFSTVGSADADKKYVCFRRVVVPGYLKARFFVNDVEYPSTKPSLQSKLQDAPSVPRDSIRMRERVSALLSQSPKFAGRERKIMLLDRNGSRRVFGPEAREKVLAMMKKVAEEKGYTFTVTGFDNMTFAKQYDVMKGVAIAVGIHGANLVNTMFMPPLAVLFELFPYGFQHEMYVNGGNAGLKYFSHQMKSGVQFDGPKHYRSVEQCVKLNHKCKVHYRDATMEVNDEDMAEMERLLREAIGWCDSLPASDGGGGGGGGDSGGGGETVGDAGEADGNGRRLRRRRRLLDGRAWGWT